MREQLFLPIPLQVEPTFSNFYPGDNAYLIAALKNFLNGQGESFIYLWGEPSVGRTHLLRACCQAAPYPVSDVCYLSLKQTAVSPCFLQGMENKRLVCLDDIDAIFGKREWEEALLHFYNRALEKSVRLVVAGNNIPPRLSCELADLRSRLSWGLVFNIAPLNDVQKQAALQMQARDRGFELPEDVIYFLLNRYPRDMTVLCQLLYTLDCASLALQRKMTVPFVKEIIGAYIES